MGLAESKCVNIEGCSSYLDDSYTVIRTGGELQKGWSISAKRHCCAATDPRSWRPGAHVSLGKEGWRVFMRLGEGDEEDHVCGWRRLGTFWPTRLSGDSSAARAAWQEELKATLERLAEEQGLPREYHEHTCARGDGLCSGCFWEKDAKDKREQRLAAERQPTPPPAEPERLISTLDEKLAELGATPYHPVYAPLQSEKE